MNVIEARQLSREFGKAHAVDSVSLDVPRGTIFGLLGPNGAGKSTLLKLLVGHLRPSTGSAAILGQPVSEWDPTLWMRIGYVSQARYLPGWMTAAECLRFARSFHRQWDEAKVFSRGHYVRVQIVIALAHNPELILLDEPTSGLDPVGRRELLTLLIEEIAPAAGRTVVFSSHLVEDIERMADCLAIMDGGRIVASGPIDTIKGSRSRVEFSSAVSDADLSALPGLVALKRGSDGTVAVTSDPDNAVQYLRSRGAADASVASVSLEQVFFDYVNRRQE
jgi:ABC-2 type transport system ATP-binding protein